MNMIHFERFICHHFMYEVSWHFVHSFTSYSRLSGATFAFVLYYHDNASSLKAMAKLDQLRFELVAHRILQTWPPATIICSQTSSDSRERDSHRMRKSSQKPKRISKAWTFRTTERTSKCWKNRNVEKMLENRYIKCIALEGNYVEE